MEETATYPRGLADERLEHRPRRVGDREELAGVLLFHGDARSGEESHRVGDAEPAEHLADRRRSAPCEVGLGHGDVRDIAAATTRNEDFGSELPGPVDGDDPERSTRCCGGASGPRGRKEPRCPGADHENVGGGRPRGRMHRATVPPADGDGS